MDGIRTHFTVRTSFSFLLLILLRTSAAQICSAVNQVDFQENNSVGDVVLTITVQPGVTLEFRPPVNPDNPFDLDGNKLIAKSVLDYEAATTQEVNIVCTETATSQTLPLVIIVVVKNVNDNPPVFDQNPYRINVNEMSPVGTSVGRFAATDKDSQIIYYTLTSESNGFKLSSPTNPDLLVATPLDFEKVKNVQLILKAEDTQSPLTSLSATTTIMITILDVDNRPPWFQPCIKHEAGGAVICQSTGYTGRVVLNEQEVQYFIWKIPGELPLKPGPLYAIDGDSGINEEVTYSFLAGDNGGLFQINPNTGNITMLKPADVLDTISLTVLAAQKTNTYQFATTTVTLSVQVKSLHRPQFQRPQYEGVITAVGVMAMDPKSKDEPLRILATDDDYAATSGINPHITYYVNGSSDFSVVGGYLFMTTDLPEATLSLQLVAMDTTNEETATAQLSVEVTSGLTTTSLPLSTTDNMASTSVGESSTDSKTTEEVSTSNPTTSTDSSLSTATNPSLTSEGSASTASTAHPPTVIVPSGGYGTVEMVALGVTLGVLLLICLVVIVVLALRIRRGNADWRKTFEASMFQSSLGQGGQKEGIQYTNEAFQNDEDGDSMGSGFPGVGSVRAGGAPGDFSLEEAVVKSSVLPLHALLQGDASRTGSDTAEDDDKEVKPILTKERRMDDGYKSVWFKEDIDPNAKEEVLIIPDRGEDDSQEEDEEPSSSGRDDDEDDDDGPRVRTPRVIFNDTDLDSGLGVKMEDLEEDEEL
ncbi:cadherin-related family member 5 [Anoplopoma fimbria]|uniref:cadherin-related family member 5 n=1 Tax=Anoplopoma fimbria TaxID=229290 RepID=UPI0023EC8F16|nr:cadherin-related family member 5 [Anoplopoma fimbria]